MKTKNKRPNKTLLDKYSERKTRGDIENTLLKGVVDVVSGSVVGTGIGALSGNKATFVGIGLILAGHYLGDESGLLRITGASAIGYGIGKVKEYQENPELNSPTKRISRLKEDWLTAFHLKWKEKNQTTTSLKPASVKK